MRIYTSYFANMKKLPPDIVPISIALKTPAWFPGPRYGLLAPTGAIFSAWKIHQDNDLYLIQYDQEVLSSLKVFDVCRDLEEISGGKDVALLCYENPRDFCHRHRAAYWFTKNGVPVSEWGEAPGGDEWEQQKLF